MPERTVFYVEEDFNERELMLRAVDMAKPSFKLRLGEDYQDSREYLSHRGLYEDLEQFPLPDLVLLDYSLKPNLLTWIHAWSDIATLPVVILGANKADHVVAECYARGANYFIEKPSLLEGWLTLVRAVDTCLLTSPVDLKSLEKFAVRPQLARKHLKATMSEARLKRAQLLSKHRELRQQLDLLMAEQKEMKRRIKFIPPAQRKPPG